MLASSNHSLAAADFTTFCKIFPVASQYCSDKGKGSVGGPELVQWRQQGGRAGGLTALSFLLWVSSDGSYC